MESALRPPLPTATQALAELQIQPWLDQRLRAKHHRTDPRKQTPGGRHQIGTPAGFKSESVAGFLLECVAGFVGIRMKPRLRKVGPREFVLSDERKHPRVKTWDGSRRTAYSTGEYGLPWGSSEARVVGLPLLFPTASIFACDAPAERRIAFSIHSAATSISRGGSEALWSSSCVTSRESRYTLYPDCGKSRRANSCASTNAKTLASMDGRSGTRENCGLSCRCGDSQSPGPSRALQAP